MNENLGIMRFRIVGLRTIRAFVTDVDILGPSRAPDGAHSTPAWVSPSSGALYCTRVGVYRPGVVRTARRSHLPGVHPTLPQYLPTLVQCAPSTTRAAKWYSRTSGLTG